MHIVDKWDGERWNPLTRKRTLRAAKKAARKETNRRYRWDNLRIYLEEGRKRNVN